MCLGRMKSFLVRSEHKAMLKVRTKYKEKLRKIYHPNLVLEKSLLEDDSSFLLQILLMIFNYLSLTSKSHEFLPVDEMSKQSTQTLLCWDGKSLCFCSFFLTKRISWLESFTSNTMAALLD